MFLRDLVLATLPDCGDIIHMCQRMSMRPIFQLSWVIIGDAMIFLIALRSARAMRICLKIPSPGHGKQGNVYCVDFSVGGRWAARKNPQFPVSNYKLAALRWPERSLQFDGHMLLTDSFREGTVSPAGK